MITRDDFWSIADEAQWETEYLAGEKLHYLQSPPYLLRNCAMKTLVIGTTFILAVGSFGAAAYGNMNGVNTEICQSIPPARPTGGATRERLEAMQHCKKEFQSKDRQTPSSSMMTQPKPPSTVPSPTLQNQPSSSSSQPSSPESKTTP